MNSSLLPALPAGAPVVIVLASGRGRRFVASGGAGSKLDAPLGGSTVLGMTLAAVAASGLPFHVERGAHAGMGDSIGAAVRATAGAGGWLILPGDLPLLRPDSLRAVAEALAGRGAVSRGDAAVTRPAADGGGATVPDAAPPDAVLPLHAGQRGHPVGFAASQRDALMALAGEQGAAPVLRACRARGRCLELALDDPGIALDIDELADLQRAERLLRERARR
ncbi:nucleotidyltransferase family protein [Derxia gummosa]|uniref:Nucleotidyltransferase family protein n=1 Tax=Derxia gummosa DSM 723 TaxID=1121388 RepID=A0A8B6X6Q3_9BURK|nr:NTP transferase domain-containing protein [Derxia gummosa]